MIYFLDQAESPRTTARWTAVTILQEARDAFLPALQFLIDLGELQHPSNGATDSNSCFKDTFRANFRLGPHGFKPIIDFFGRIHRLCTAQRYKVSPEEFNLQMETLNAYSAPLHSLLIYFRTSVDRMEYDPIPFSDLRWELQSGSGKFAVRFHFTRSCIDISIFSCRRQTSPTN
jgi:hypothetical protein